MNALPIQRLGIIAAILFILFSSLLARFYTIQILEHEKWTQIALTQHEYEISIPFMRGSFYSNTSLKQGHPEKEAHLVMDVPKFHLFLDPRSIPNKVKSKMAEQLFAQLHFSEEQRQKMRPEFEKKSRSRKIATWLDQAEKKEIQTWWKSFAKKEKIPLNAIFFRSEFRRSYPFGSLLGAVLHTVQEEREPHTRQGLPTGGLEFMFDSYLQGRVGKKRMLRSPRHSLESGYVVTQPENGADIYLTINHYLQAIAETELQKGVQAVNAQGGWAVMMDCHSGEIWAMAQTPSFDPSRYADYFKTLALQDATRIRAITDCYEPGSIFKPITLAVCMKANAELAEMGQEPIFSPEEMIATSNGWFAGRTKPLKDARVHRFLNMDLAVQKSSNIYMGKLIQRVIEKMGDAWYRKTLQEIFGFGQKTKIELPAESVGLLPTPGKLHPNGKLEWSAPTPYSLAIGHNILVTAVQMARAYAILANGGKEVEPHLVQKIVKKRGDGSVEVLLDRTRSESGRQCLDSTFCEAIVKSMKFATKEGGTSKRADIPGYTEAGKSGTSEKVIDGVYSKDHNISSFLGFAPASNPRFVLLISIDDPEKKWVPGVGKQQFGGVCAAPVFREIAEKALQYLGIAPDDSFGYPPGDPRRDPERSDYYSQLQELKALYNRWNGEN